MSATDRTSSRRKSSSGRFVASVPITPTRYWPSRAPSAVRRPGTTARPDDGPHPQGDDGIHTHRDRVLRFGNSDRAEGGDKDVVVEEERTDGAERRRRVPRAPRHGEREGEQQPIAIESSALRSGNKTRPIAPTQREKAEIDRTSWSLVLPTSPRHRLFWSS